MNDTKPKATRDRSPAFPYVSLRRARQLLEGFHSAYGTKSTLLSNAYKTWGLSPKSSKAHRTVSALKAFGLFSDSGQGQSRRIEPTAIGKKILIDKREGVLEKCLAEAAVKPAIIRQCIEKWEGDRPHNEACLSELQIEMGFTDEAARRFLKVFDETVEFVQTKSWPAPLGEKSAQSDAQMPETQSDPHTIIPTQSHATGFNQEPGSETREVCSLHRQEPRVRIVVTVSGEPIDDGDVMRMLEGYFMYHREFILGEKEGKKKTEESK